MTSNERSLNGIWQLRDEVLSTPPAEAQRIAAEKEGWIDQPVPGDIHQGLISAGRIAPPLVGLNSFECAWTEQRSWWFRRVFDSDPGWAEADVVELEMQGLDANAEIFLNGVHIGCHPSAFRPFVTDVTRRLQPTGNVLLVRLTSGLETVSELDVDHCDGVRAGTEASNGRPERGDPRRIFARKPQYSWGWDWSPRLATTAIGGDVILRAMTTATIRDVALLPVRQGDQVDVAVTVTVDHFHYYRTTEGRVRVSLTDEEGRISEAEVEVLLRSGLTHVDLVVRIAEPQFWWPNGLGEQHRYRAQAELVVGDQVVTYPEFLYGLRFVELESLDDFAFVINGRKVFAKGANWIPGDALYARMTDGSYAALVREAYDAGFNMLRVWGGGLYEGTAFYEACDRHGIMVWHDFMFGCAPYPDDLPEFRAEVEREVDYQTRRLRRHASLVLWCGNNENTWGFVDWWHERTEGGAHLYNYLLPAVVRRNCPEIPYWNSSPYGGARPNDADVGDRHHWGDAMMHADMATRITPEIYDACHARFVSEFGYIGAPVKETVLDYLDGAPFEGGPANWRAGAVWQHHTNTFEKDTVDAGIRKHYVDPEALSPDDYLLYSGLVQGLMLGYALDSMRARANCHGSLFWMFADCWGEVGWTIVDAYGRRKPAWYFVRRAYAPLRLIVRAEGDDALRVIAANDTGEDVGFVLETGYVSLDGMVQDLTRADVSVPALQRSVVATFGRGDHDAATGLWIARAADLPEVPVAVYRARDTRQLQLPVCRLELIVTARDAMSVVARVHAPVYAHGVHFDLPSGASVEDQYFDLLPGETREVVITSLRPLEPEAVTVRCVNACG